MRVHDHLRGVKSCSQGHRAWEGQGRVGIHPTRLRNPSSVPSVTLDSTPCPVPHFLPLPPTPTPPSLLPLKHSSCNKWVCCSQEGCVGFLIIHYNQPDWFFRRISRRWVFKMQIPPFRDPLESTEAPLVDPSMPWQFFVLFSCRSSEEPAGWLNLCKQVPGKRVDGRLGGEQGSGGLCPLSLP